MTQSLNSTHESSYINVVVVQDNYRIQSGRASQNIEQYTYYVLCGLVYPKHMSLESYPISSLLDPKVKHSS